ncbi:hypothetical protein M378DRAFT_185341 [Amanita muscaria Koide BX008]|uniref:IgA peptidase M64 n=1 Tax=Amanita muscaria (strain Koide BX008) TaxID=946122 RepID=A0A0C2TKX2_AMAMK|nr:hypothetical protein M378DRAFT_185341 [Amanita muscaria Koide BX008]
MNHPGVGPPHGKCLTSYSVLGTAFFNQGCVELGLPLEVHPLIVSGPTSNRVDLVFFSDGYVESELPKFLQDSMRLAKDISSNQTFNTVKPLLNFWAAFSPSKESGIGVGGKPKDTVFGLYRDGTELRGVYYSKPEIASAFCSDLGDQCDYPILLGNDPYYGGLGGEFTVITSSLDNGPLVLRHELGHSIIDVGEEYDGGFAYFGVNAAHNLSQPLPWAHWLTTSPADSGSPRVERSVMPMQAYPWTLLERSKPWQINFTSAGTYSRHLVRFSLSGLPSKSDLAIELDGVVLDWTPRPDIGLDRWHYDIQRHSALNPGVHQLRFSLLNGERQGIAQLCSVEILEFGDESEFVTIPGYYGIFPTYSETNLTTYRPTNEDCLMRAVTMPNLCKVCLEGLWLSLLRRVDFIDDLEENCQLRVLENGSKKAWVKTVEAVLVPLAHLRQALPNKESYTLTWYKDGRILDKFTNRTVLELDDDELAGSFFLQVKFSTDEVRLDRDGLLERRRHFQPAACTGSY